MKNMLFFTPHWSTSHPYLSLPCLVAYLRENNVDVSQRDLNIECFYYFFSKTFLESCKEKILTKNLKNELIEKYLLIYDYLTTNIETALKTLADRELFYDIERYKAAKCFIDEAYNFISLAYSPFSIGRNKISFGEDVTLENIAAIISDTSLNPYIEFYKRQIKDDDIRNINFAGISLSGESQLVPVITLCKYLKEKNRSIHITIGGNTFSKIFNKIESIKELFVYLDSILVFEGEYPLLKLINAISDCSSLKEVPNLIYKDGENLIFNDLEKMKVPIEEMPLPDFEGLDLSKYTAPEVILPYYTSRSCFWHRCTFCDHDYGYDGSYRVKSINKVITDIKKLKQYYNVKVVHFIDEALTVSFLDKLSSKLIEEDIGIKWFCYIKADKKFSADLCRKFKEAGCLHVLIGVESCSTKILNDMDKGIDLEDIRVTLENMNRSGIWAHSFLINDFPTETDKEKLETMIFILSNKEIFHSIGLSEFTLSKNSKIMKECKKYGIEHTVEASDFSNDLEMNVKQNKEVWGQLQKAYSFNSQNYFMSKTAIEREHLPLYQKEYELIHNKQTLESFIDDNRFFGSKYLLYREVGDKLLIYNLKNKKQFIVTKEFQMLIEFLKQSRSLSDVTDFLNDAGTSSEVTSQIISFMETSLFA